MQEVKGLSYIDMVIGFLRETPDNRKINREYPVSHPPIGRSRV